MKRIILIFTLLIVANYFPASIAQNLYTSPPFQVSIPLDYHRADLAIISDSNILADVLAMEFHQRGFRVAGAEKTNKIFRQLHISRKNFLTPDNLIKLKDQPIDCLLVIDTIKADPELQIPASSQITLHSAFTGRPLASTQWHYNVSQQANLSGLARNITRELLTAAEKQTDWGY